MNGKRTMSWTFIFLVVAAGSLLLLGWLVVKEGAAPAAAVLFVLGSGALITAPFAPRLEGALRIGPLQLTLRQQVINAAQKASEESLEGVLPLLTSDDVSVTRLRVPSRFDGMRLTVELQFLRQKLNVSVLGILMPGEDQWMAGGGVSELAWREAAEVLVAGHPDTLAYLRFLIAADDDDLWQRVT